MEKIIIIRYCEIHLKGKNRIFFERLLEQNIEKAIFGIDLKFKKVPGRYLIEDFNIEDEDLIINKLKKVFGIHTMSVGLLVKSDLDEIYEACEKLCYAEGEFKVETNRADKTFMSSLEVSSLIGGKLLDKYPNLKVNVKKPKFTVNIDIRENGKTYVFCASIKGPGGMPTGSAGNGMVLISGGIDSPVASYMLAKRGMKLCAVHFHSFPYTSDQAKQKVIDLSKLVSEYSIGLKLHIVSFTEIQEAIHEKCPEEMMITMMRRFMMKIAEKLAYKNRCGALITGESLGQVASQTLESIISSNSVVKMPVFRPLIGMDKLEIIEIAEKIGTYETSILPYEDCCTVFLPKFPLIKPNMENVLKAEALLDVDDLIQTALKNVEVIEL